MIEGIRRNGITLAWFAIMTACAGGFVWSQTSPVHSSVSVQATQATLTIALWESKSYLIRTTPGQPPSFDPVTIAYVQLGTDGPVPPPPPPPTLTVRAKAIHAAAIKATTDPKREESAGNLAAMCSAIAVKVRAGEIKTYTDIAGVTLGAWDLACNQSSIASAWAPTRKVIGDELTKLAQDGAADSEFAKYLEEVADGIKASTSRLQAIDLQKIMKWIQLIMEILKLIPLEDGAVQPSDGAIPPPAAKAVTNGR